MSSPQTAISVVFGSMTIGPAGKAYVRVSTIEDTNQILDVFQKHGHSEIDTARNYGAGTTEKYLADAKWQHRGLSMDTKLYLTKGKTRCQGRVFVWCC